MIPSREKAEQLLQEGLQKNPGPVGRPLQNGGALRGKNRSRVW